jgi:coenzyme F420-0:L-glutamate ligase/coenzyme F420-1:gamma-L-glutamate ligase
MTDAEPTTAEPTNAEPTDAEPTDAEPTNAEPADGLAVLPVRGIGDVMPGDDLAELIAGAAPWLRDGDVLVVTSKVVSKAEGRLVDVPADGPGREEAREEALRAETVRVVARRGRTAIVQTRHGFVMAAAGIDASNVDKTHLVLLPLDPDASARALRRSLRARTGLDVGVVVSDTMGRTWRNGLTDVALGAAGVAPFRDHRGEIDPYGNELELTEMAVIDELAAAGELVKGKCDQVPVAVVRGYPRAGGADGPGAVALVRGAAGDMFSQGTAEARAAGRTDAAVLADAVELPGGPVDPAVVNRALATVAPVIAPGTVFTAIVAGTGAGTATGAFVTSAEAENPSAVISCSPARLDPAALIRFGADVHRLRAALSAEGLASSVVSDGTGVRIAVSGL